ncbi:MAG TPA: single-stranded DNA-binding protein [Verrucomicrobia bacterium]|nr:single-stranded DNA-binding protein [Verrucomicrobiota bacterium]
MASFNRVILMGNLTRDPDVRATGTTGMKVARLGIAVNERRKDRNGQIQDFPVFIDVDAWDKLAELCGQYLSKGRSILVEGRLQMDTWEKDGVRHQKLKVRASTIKFLPQGDRLNGGAPRQTAAESELGAAIAAPGAPAEPLENDPDNLPF